jgi:hypothetical protein
MSDHDVAGKFAIYFPCHEGAYSLQRAFMMRNVDLACAWPYAIHIHDTSGKF